MPRPTTAVPYHIGELADLMSQLFGPVSYVGIHVDPELQYPKGAARVTFGTEEGFLKAMEAKFMLLPHDGITKRVEIKPYIMEDGECDECGMSPSSGFHGVMYCANLDCLQYYCKACWSRFHDGDMSLISHRPVFRPTRAHSKVGRFFFCSYDTAIVGGSLFVNYI
ncbi:unnamed protein product [Anisakis simplex]|uniref:FOG-1 protein (inferred by orthology to a C. elegans protein) n=1 Tax=Anisakis simplex TaxID=6269 RepID=A0A0M3KK15_ANISI|nr:unnamed protein product [Anisakis simplex]